TTHWRRFIEEKHNEKTELFVHGALCALLRHTGVRAGRRSNGCELGRHHLRFCNGDCVRGLRNRAGESHGGRGRRSCPQPGGAPWNSARADSRTRADRISGAVHAGYHLCEGEVEAPHSSCSEVFCSPCYAGAYFWRKNDLLCCLYPTAT